MSNAKKTCKKCGFTKPITSFGKAPRCAGGRRSTCHRCKDGKAPLAAAPEEMTAEEVTTRFARKLDSKVYIITAAQNATNVHGLFFETLKVMAKHRNAELVIVPLRYKNPTSLAPDERDDWWDPAAVPFLFNQRKKLNPNIVLAADIKTQPTASSPLTGFEALTGAESCIIAHPKMQLRTISVPSSDYPKILTTTGACTLSNNYSDTKAGKIGQFHHFLGAIVVEVVGKLFYLRQLNANREDGSFTDLEHHYTPGGVFDAPPPLAIVLGDTHQRITSPQVDRATFGDKGIVPTLNVEKIYWHDVTDGETCNPHEEHDPFLAAAKQKSGRQDIRAEIQDSVNFVNERSKGRESFIVDSNHPDFIRRWVVKQLHTGCHDAKNLGFFLESATYMHASARMTPEGPEYDDPFPYWFKKLGAGENVHMLRHDQSSKVADIECSLHGDDGPNGARGTMANLARLGVKVCSAHRHYPEIFEGHYGVGTSTSRRQSYHRGPGNNLNTHCLIYATGARALVTIIGEDWRGNV